jgi:DNA repair exonuclease SbcCD ATPase subunit
LISELALSLRQEMLNLDIQALSEPWVETYESENDPKICPILQPHPLNPEATVVSTSTQINCGEERPFICEFNPLKFVDEEHRHEMKQITDNLGLYGTSITSLRKEYRDSVERLNKQIQDLSDRAMIRIETLQSDLRSIDNTTGNIRNELLKIPNQMNDEKINEIKNDIDRMQSKNEILLQNIERNSQKLEGFKDEIVSSIGKMLELKDQSSVQSGPSVEALSAAMPGAGLRQSPALGCFMTFSFIILLILI